MSNGWAQVYDALGLHQIEETLARWALQQASAAGMSIQHACDLSCATGAGALLLAEAGAQVLGVERDLTLLQVAQHKASAAKQRVVWIGDDLFDDQLDTAAFAERCDLVISSAGLGQAATTAALERLLATVVGLLRPGGLFVGVVAREAPPEPSDRVLRDDADYLAFERSEVVHEHGPITRRVVWFTREIELWWRDEYSWTEYIWPEWELVQALNAEGLALIEWQPADSTHGRDVFIAQSVLAIQHS